MISVDSMMLIKYIIGLLKYYELIDLFYSLKKNEDF